MTILTGGIQAPPGERARPEQVARQMEGFFWRVLTRELRRGVPGPTGGLSGRMFDDLLSEALAEQAAGSMRLGFSERLQAQLGLESSRSARPRPRSGAAGNPGMPVAGRISSGYGPRRDPFSGQTRFHHGVDIAAPRGSPIRALAAGRVIQAGPLGNYGHTVRIRAADGTEYTYAHCDRIAVEAGQRVPAGAPIAGVGATGRATGPHLHLEVRRGGRSLDPSRLIDSGAGPDHRAFPGDLQANSQANDSVGRAD